LDPSHATLATKAAVSVDTVQRQLERLRELGLLSWQRRLIRDESTGWRVEQTSNAYVLTPAACEPQIAAPVQVSLKKKDRIEAEQMAPEVRHGTLATLAAIANRRMRALGLA
jgi:DNA-binding transcriptional MocR family regulator